MVRYLVNNPIMKKVNIYQAKAHLSGLLDRVAQGRRS